MNILRFSFAVADKRSSYSVYSTNMNDIILFMNQHGFNYEECESYINVIQVTPQVRRDMRDRILQLFVFKSNKNVNENFNVMTTSELVCDALTYVGDEITKSCYFGEAIIKNNFPIIDILSDMISKLKYAEVMDYTDIVDDVLFEEYDYTPDTDKKNLIKDKLNNFHLNNVDNPNTTEYEQPITIEGYVAAFTSLL